MKVHQGVEDKKNARRLAKKVGLNKVKTKDTYTLYKTGAKVSSPYGYPDEMYCERGNVYVAAHEEHIWIIVDYLGRWFKTSPVLSCVPIENGFKLETHNSYYELRK